MKEGEAERWDLLLAVMGTPHQSDMTTTVMRLAYAALAKDETRVKVWTCGYATLLTQRRLGDFKPKNVLRWSVDYPSMVTLVRELIDGRSDRFHWYACRFCSEERGATDHIPEVRVVSPHKFADHVTSARKTLWII